MFLKAAGLLVLTHVVQCLSADVTTTEECTQWMEGLSRDDLADIIRLNCEKVNSAKEEFLDATKSSYVTDEQQEDWDHRIYNATMGCKKAQSLFTAGNPYDGALAAVQAFGSYVMMNKMCCVRLRAPTCISVRMEKSSFEVRTPAGVLIVVMVVMIIMNLVGHRLLSWKKRWAADHKQEEEPDDAVYISSTGSPPPGSLPAPRPDDALRRMLEDEWIRGSSLKVLPGAHRMAASAASLFSGLFTIFEFQRDSVRNQYDHLLSMLRSHVSTVADRYVGNDEAVDESFLLVDALDDLHHELLEGFTRWREKFRACEATGFNAEEGGIPKAGGATRDGQWAPIPATLCRGGEEEAQERNRQLVEVAVYLLVWGEGGNVRFMPEIIYFITEMALSAEGPGGAHFYGLAPQDGAYHSGRFLAKIIRPLYTLVFDEWYQKVDINAKGGDAKALHKGFQRYLLPDVANYDDWNEFFCEPEEVAQGILLNNGFDLFSEPVESRFKVLKDVHWQASLKGSQIKTHRECHSFWGVFAATHRVWFLHALLFFIGVCIATGSPSRAGDSILKRALLGEEEVIRLAAVGLIVPVHALVVALARGETTSNNLWRRAVGWHGCCPGGACCWHLPTFLMFLCKAFFWTIVFSAPIATYLLMRYVDGEYVQNAVHGDDSLLAARNALLVVHYCCSAIGIFFLLLAPAYKIDRLFPLTFVPLRLRIVRYLFWTLVMSIKFLLGIKVFLSVWNVTQWLDFISIGRESPSEIMGLWRSSAWAAHFYEWGLVWGTCFFLFCADTAMWFQLGCMFLGVCIVFVQRGCAIFDFLIQDDISRIPQRFSEKVFYYAPRIKSMDVAEHFPPIWDRIVAYMRYEDKCESDLLGAYSYTRGSSRGLFFDRLSLQKKPLRPTKKPDTQPQCFHDMTVMEVVARNYCVLCRGELQNADMKWRLFALARGLGLPIPRPYRPPFIPGLTVLIPHYGETIIMSKSELYDKGSGRETLRTRIRCPGFNLPVRETVPLIDWLRARYSDEYKAFTHRMAAREDWPSENSWNDFNDKQWEKICVWSSMRMQTLYRTVAGMMLYHPALEAHYIVQRLPQSSLAQEGIWNPTDCFNCIVSMQIYKQFDKTKLAHTNKMFDKFPDSLKVAYIDWEDLVMEKHESMEVIPRNAQEDRVHRRQKRRYFSGLIDKHCQMNAEGRRAPRYRVELPGYPILGDGKSDNQNHAIIFMRGIFCQCIDANQGAYFEQMLMLPCVLGEFRNYAVGRGKAKRIIGLPEHITSDFGSIGDFAAGSEIAFGTISQRSFAVLGGRMHYGHPDMMNKQYMMQQGGVSKATKTINLSEDIFAGMDFTLRGQGRKIRHCEYFHLAKGRDLGFNAVLGFFSKLSNGTGEQLLTRQMLRLSHCLQLPESLTFYYAHAGYYITQFLVSVSMPILVFTWLLVLCADCDREFRAFGDGTCNVTASEAMASMLATWYSVYILFFLIVTSLPLFAEIWMERNFGAALARWIKQQISCSFLLFIFQAKIIGYYIMAEIRQGGASYVATGRGLPTDRREFVGAPCYKFFRISLRLKGIDPVLLNGNETLQETVCNTIESVACNFLGCTKMLKVTVAQQDSGSRTTARFEICLWPPNDVATISMKDKITSGNFGPALAGGVESISGIGRVCRSALEGTANLDQKQTGWHCEKVGGLYLDYTQHTYYHGMALLMMTLLVLAAGGYSEAGQFKGELWWTFLSLALVVYSWLYAPFIFNPYQFSAGYLLDDIKAWSGFFLRSGGKHWADWFERVLLKPKRGLATSILDIELLFSFFAATAWVSVLYTKQVQYEVLYNKDPIVYLSTIAVMIPPFVLSLCYCILVAVVEYIGGCRKNFESRAQQSMRGIRSYIPYRRAKRTDEDSQSSDEEAGSPPTASPTVTDSRHVMEDAEVLDKPEHRICEHGMPLALSGVIIASLELIEIFGPLMVTFSKRLNWKTLVAGIMVKFLFWNIFLFLAGSALSMTTFCRKVEQSCGFLHKILKLLVYGNGIARDMFISAFIFITLLPYVLINAINDYCMPRFSLHQTLIYRTPGPLAKKQMYYDCASDGSGSDDEEESEGSSGGSSPTRRYPSGSSPMGILKRMTGRS